MRPTGAGACDNYCPLRSILLHVRTGAACREGRGKEKVSEKNRNRFSENLGAKIVEVMPTIF